MFCLLCHGVVGSRKLRACGKNPPGRQQIASEVSQDRTGWLSQQRRMDVPVIRSGFRKPNQPLSGEELRRILHLEVPVIVKLGQRTLSMSEVMRLGVGAIIEFAKSSEESLDLMINNKTIGYGEAVKVGENFGLRITQIGDVRDIISAMGSGAGESQG